MESYYVISEFMVNTTTLGASGSEFAKRGAIFTAHSEKTSCADDSGDSLTPNPSP